MNIPALTPLIRRITHLRARRIHPRLQTTDDFRKTLVSAQSGADRAGHELSLIIFTFRKADMFERTCFAREVIDDVRSIDEVGWIRENSIGVLLPYTPNSGAKKLVSRIFHGQSSSSRDMDASSVVIRPDVSSSAQALRSRRISNVLN